MFACLYSRAPLTRSGNSSLLDCAGIFSPRVEDTAPGTTVLDLAGLERLFGSHDEIANLIHGEACTRGLQISIGIASNPDTAVHVARGWAGITIVPAGDEAVRLRTLPLDVLSAPSEVLETAARWGIRTFGDFAKLQPRQVAERLGQEGVYLHKLARGGGSRPLVPRQDPLHFEGTMELEHAVNSLEPMTFILTRLLDPICMRLRTRGLATFEARLHLVLERSNAVFQRVLRLPLPVCNARLLVKLFILDLEAHPPDAAIVKVTVEAKPAKPRVAQNGLFVPLSPEPEKLELTLARIAAVVGEENIGSPEILNTHRPDAFRMQHFGTGNFELRIANFEFRDRPAIRMFRPPREATVEVRNGVPVWIAFRGLHGPIDTASGPWRTSGNWWTHTAWNRDEWDIEVEPLSNSQFAIRNSKFLCRIFRDLTTGRWFAQGIFD
jgi:protein ImuB